MFIIFRHVVELPTKDVSWSSVLDYTFETSAEITRDCKERQHCIEDWLLLLSRTTHVDARKRTMWTVW